MTAALLMLAAHIVARRNPTWAPTLRELESAPAYAAPRRTIWVVPIVFGLSIGGLYVGVFTPIEAGAAGAFLAVTFRQTWPDG